jgi:hypothetical protein
MAESDAEAMTSVAASSTTAYPMISSWRRMAVFPAPGGPVRMYDGMAVPSRAERAMDKEADAIRQAAEKRQRRR